MAGMARLFYSSQAYRSKQSALTRKNWEIGKFDSLLRRVKRICARQECLKSFVVVQHDPKKYCSQACAAIMNNKGRRMLEDARRKISQSLRGREGKNPFKGMIKVPRTKTTCANPACNKIFFHERYKKRKYCCNQCQMTIVGGRPTSPKASKGKNGVRKDISPTINFYSRWEANIARLYTYLKIKWEYAPKSFDIGGQKYTPDFYLPESGTYVEVKNFWWSYSKIRDGKFRERYPNIRLDVILKEQYLELEKKYAHLIPNWEYKNSRFNSDFVYATAAQI